MEYFVLSQLLKKRVYNAGRLCLCVHAVLTVFIQSRHSDSTYRSCMINGVYNNPGCTCREALASTLPYIDTIALVFQMCVFW